MMTSLAGRRVRAGLLGLALLAAPALAAELKIYPVRLTLTPQEPVASMTVQNGGSETTVFQLRVMSWRQEGGEDVFEPTREVLANPGIFELRPGTEQIARFGLAAGPAARPGYYRVFIQEVPARQVQKPGEVMALLQISVPIFSPAPNAAGRLTWRVRPTADGELDVEIRNDGDGHVQVTGISLSRADGQVISDQRMSTYILPGAWRRVTLVVRSAVNPGDRLELAAETDQTPISEAVVVGEAGRNGQDVL